MVNEKQKSYIVELKEINDGSGDMILELPPEVIEGLGWKMGDTVSYEVRDKSIFVKKKE
ncbi:AbrB/MazE/SpoVT family DNA-binding domain-containing protein [archaeon]|nr:AbrB/MazE/SpoVT family DNA-binding domain-containing protein [archaeon]